MIDTASKISLEMFGTSAKKLTAEESTFLIGMLVTALNEKDLKIMELEDKIVELKLRRKKKAGKEIRALYCEEL